MIILFYKYVTITYPKQIAKWQKSLCEELGLTGRIIIAQEGINATIGGSDEAIEEYKRQYLAHEYFGGTDIKTSPGDARDFPRLSIKVRDTIVNLGIDPAKLKPAEENTHLSPEQVHELIQKDKDLVIFDARNNYESRIGTFKNAITPDLDTFRDFPRYLDDHAEEFKDKKVLMFCTGGVRCERLVSYAKTKGMKECYQIDGGIHRYVEKYPDGFFRGKNYVFDERVAVRVNDDILSNCDLCNVRCDDYTNCMNSICNKKFITCEPCREEYQYCCSEKCKNLVQSKEVPVRKTPLVPRNA